MILSPAETWVDELTSFILSQPTPEQVIDFQASDAVNDHLHQLLDKNSEGSLTIEERDELNRFLELDHIFTMLKAKARLQLAGEE